MKAMISDREVSPDREIILVLELWKDDEVLSEVASPVLVGRLVADFKRFSTRVIAEGLTRIWNLRQQVKVSEVQDNTFVFLFSSIAEKERVIAGSPWSFAGFMLCLKEWPASVELEAIEFDHVEMWVQVSGLPPNQMTRRKAAMIGTLFASVVEVDLPLENSPFWGKFFKMKVMVGTANPLPTGFLNKSQGDSASWVSFQYVNLVDYCYYCARMGHVEKECPFLSEDRRKGRERTKPIPGIFELRAPKSSIKLLTVGRGGRLDSGRPGRSNQGMKARKTYSEAKHVGSTEESDTRDDACGLGHAAHEKGISNQGVGQEQWQDSLGMGTSSKTPNLTQPLKTNIFQNGIGEPSTQTSSAARLSLKKQARLRASSSPASLPPQAREPKADTDVSELNPLPLNVTTSLNSDMMAVVAGPQPQGKI
ncbi:hypothetical protein Tsubulata_002563 [Turnera subulata]|uniref:CCHC-type domain-containing protein n=1 Tax=Turnera subulata TaxID=218843 RepID=A0A9Q0JKJ7_9ROSI|nr:hypothetical protein Tsubulata_002563 [Turnera subulata]